MTFIVYISRQKQRLLKSACIQLSEILEISLLHCEGRGGDCEGRGGG